jgi:hypothetical protein
MGCGYRIVKWVDEGSVPFIEGYLDHPLKWCPHLDDGDSRRLQIEMEIDISVGAGSDGRGRVAKVSYPAGGVPPIGKPAWEISLGQLETNEDIRSLVLLCAAFRILRMLDPKTGSNVVLLRRL